MKFKYPRVSDLINKAIKRVPFFISEYLFSGTGNDKVVHANNDIFKNIFLIPKDLKGSLKPNIAQKFLGSEYGAPLGCTNGSGGSIWPGAEIALAKCVQKIKFHIVFHQ